MGLETSIKEAFFELIQGDISLADFEQWTYENKELEKSLSEKDYLDIISFDYKQNGAKYELVKLLEHHIDLGELETIRLRRLLDKVLRKDANIYETIASFYDLYCHGYYFLEELGMTYGLALECPPPTYEHSDITPEQEQKIIDSFYPQIENDVRKVLTWLDHKKIILTGTYNNLGYHSYIDNRSPDEKRTSWRRVEITTRKRWWQFWK